MCKGVKSINDKIDDLSGRVFKFDNREELNEFEIEEGYMILTIDFLGGNSFKLYINEMINIFEVKLFICKYIIVSAYTPLAETEAEAEAEASASAIDYYEYLDHIDINLSYIDKVLKDEYMKDIGNIINCTIIKRANCKINTKCTFHDYGCMQCEIGSFWLQNHFPCDHGIIMPLALYDDDFDIYLIPKNIPINLQNNFTQLSWYFFRNKFEKLLKLYHSSKFKSISFQLQNQSLLHKDNHDVFVKKVFMMDLNDNYEMTFSDFI